MLSKRVLEGLSRLYPFLDQKNPEDVERAIIMLIEKVESIDSLEYAIKESIALNTSMVLDQLNRSEITFDKQIISEPKFNQAKPELVMFKTENPTSKAVNRESADDNVNNIKRKRKSLIK